MEAHQTVPELPLARKPLAPISPRHGVVTLFGYGISARVDRGHLILDDGIGPLRRHARFPRVNHGLRRLVIIGADGFVSFGALRWLVDQSVSLSLLERDGAVLATTGPVHPSDARLRRAQSLAHQSGLALHIAIELIRRKLVGQESVARSKLANSVAADAITKVILALGSATDIDTVRELEARGANAYWLAWREIPIQFPLRDLQRVPDHWRKFGTRRSPLTGSGRLAVNPLNAMLNYLYAILESESSLALTALGLDPGIGVLHFDSRSRDSFACDLMEAVRPQVDAYVLDWVVRQPLRREWFFEQRDGNCRLMAKLAVQLSETAEMWKGAVAPVAEWVCRALSSSLPKPSRQITPATRLTQNHRRISKGGVAIGNDTRDVRPPNVCRLCGKPLNDQRQRMCGACALEHSRDNMREAAKLGRIATHSPSAEALRSAAKRRHDAERKNWEPSNLPDWLTEARYRQKLQPRLAAFSVPKIATALGLSEPYATDIRAGKRVPHPRHWLPIARLVGVSADIEVVEPNLCSERT
jgi:CRISPR-associated endonuclease Cas1